MRRPPETMAGSPAGALAPGEIHVVRARLDPPAPILDRLRGDLSEEELERAGRMRFPHLRHAAVASAAILRHVLARYVGAEPSELDFARGAYGKPTLALLAGRAAPRFNLSHSGDLALVAVSAEHEVGIDIEEIVPARCDDTLASRVLTQRELRLWRGAPLEARPRLFFEVWTHKEAWMKATGRGLSLDPLSFEVLVEEERDVPRLAREIDAAHGVGSLLPLEAGRDHAAALAVLGPPGVVRTWDWELDRT